MLRLEKQQVEGLQTNKKASSFLSSSLQNNLRGTLRPITVPERPEAQMDTGSMEDAVTYGNLCLLGKPRSRMPQWHWV